MILPNIVIIWNIQVKHQIVCLLRRRHERTGIMNESKQAAQAGGKVAKNARQDLERQLGRSVISSQRASDYIHPIEDAKAKELPVEEDE